MVHINFRLIRRQSRITSNTAHGEWVDGVGARNEQCPLPVRHDVVFTLASDDKTRLLKGADCRLMVDSRNLGHDSDRDFDFSRFTQFVFGQFNGGRQVFPNGIADVFQRLLFGGALRPAAGQAGAVDIVARFAGMKNDAVFHGCVLRRFAYYSGRME